MVAIGAQTLVVNPSLPARNVKEPVALARARLGQINFASSGTGGPTQLAGELLKSLTGINIVHVPYKGGGQVANDVIAGQCEMTFVGAPASLPHVRSGRLRLLAVTTAKRLSTLPDVPTVAESGYPDFNVVASYSVLAPAGTPAAIVSRLSTELAKIANQPEMRERLAALGIEPWAARRNNWRQRCSLNSNDGPSSRKVSDSSRNDAGTWPYSGQAAPGCPGTDHRRNLIRSAVRPRLRWADGHSA